MGNYSDELTHLSGVRVAGIKGNTPGEVYGGRYYPAVRDAQGNVITSARFTCSVYINRKGRRQEDGSMIEGRRDIIDLTFWNTRNSAAGKGLADIAAKCLSPGKEFDCRALLHSYQGRVFDNGNVVMKQDGTGPLTTRKTGYTIEAGSLRFGDDSEKLLAAEFQRYNGQPSFLSRPMNWNTPGHADNVAWKAISDWRMSQVPVQGQSTYGYALIVTQDGQASTQQPSVNAQSVAGAVQTPAIPATGAVYPQGTIINGVDMSGQPAGSMPATQPVHNAAGAPTVF